MIGVDSLLRIALSHAADELRLATDAAPAMFQRGAPLRLSVPATPDDTLRMLLGPLLADHEAELAAGKIEVTHQSGGESFAVTITPRGSGLEAIFRRAAKATKAPAPAPPPRPRAPTPVSSVVAPVAATTTATAAKASPAGDLWTKLLSRAVQLNASDVHLWSGEAPTVRIDGRLRTLADFGALSVEELWGDRLAQGGETTSHDFAVEHAGLGRFRVHLYRASERWGAAVRLLTRAAPTLADLQLPLPLDDLVTAPHGMILVSGATGSGKSMTLAALAAAALRRRPGLLITLEDPVEYMLTAEPGSLIRRRQIGTDVRDFPSGLRDALREDPDVLLIGEMRDPETISLAITAAETGHLVLSSLHSRSAASSIERIVDAYPAERQPQLRAQLADAIRAIVSQRLLPRADGPGRVVALEVLRANDAVANLIRDGKAEQISSVLQSSRKEGMVPLERCLADLVKSGQVTRQDALAAANDVKSLGDYLRS